MHKNNWLTKERLLNYSYIFLMVYTVIFCYWLNQSTGNFDPNGKPLGTDFTSFYTAAKLVLEGKPSFVYDFTLHFNAEQKAVGDSLLDYYSFSYPPTFLLILAPLGNLSYITALIVWLSTTFTFFIIMMRKITSQYEASLLIISFPAVFLTIEHGQNAFLTTGLLAGSLYYMKRKPIVAGLLIGLLTFKPHLGLLIPFILIISRQWKVFFSASITATLFFIISYFFYGLETWMAFISSMSDTTNTLNNGVVPYFKMQSFYTSLRNINVNIINAYIIHSIIAIFVMLSVFWVWLQKVDIYLKYASLCLGTLLITPFLLDYDLTILAIPITYIALYGIKMALLLI